jgi:hypothetical protein
LTKTGVGEVASVGDFKLKRLRKTRQKVSDGVEDGGSVEVEVGVEAGVEVAVGDGDSAADGVKAFPFSPC